MNHPELFSESYRRFIENRMREALPFAEVPIRLLLRAHHEGGAPPRRRARPRRRR